MDLKPIYETTWSCGPSLIYRVSVNIGGRNWEERDVLVPVVGFMQGQRTFGYLNGYGAGLPEHKVTQKMAARIEQDIAKIHEWQSLKREYDELMKRVVTLRESMRTISADIVGLRMPLDRIPE